MQSAAPAQERTPSINRREHRQKERLTQGVQSGELTHKEAKGLAKEQAKIHAEERVAKSDGKVTKAERAKIQHDQNKANRHLKRQKHDAQTR